MKNGFTLIELLVVLAVIAILAALIIPVFHQVKQANENKAIQAEQSEVTDPVVKDIEVVTPVKQGPRLAIVGKKVTFQSGYDDVTLTIVKDSETEREFIVGTFRDGMTIAPIR